MERDNVKKLISQAMSELAKMSHKKKPRTKAFYKAMSEKRWAKKKLSTPPVDTSLR